MKPSAQCYTDGMKAHVWVMPKRTVLDPQGQRSSTPSQGSATRPCATSARANFFVLNLDGWSRDEAQKQLEHISKEVLTNTVIENTALRSLTELSQKTVSLRR